MRQVRFSGIEREYFMRCCICRFRIRRKIENHDLGDHHRKLVRKMGNLGKDLKGEREKRVRSC